MSPDEAARFAAWHRKWLRYTFNPLSFRPLKEVLLLRHEQTVGRTGGHYRGPYRPPQYIRVVYRNGHAERLSERLKVDLGHFTRLRIAKLKLAGKLPRRRRHR
jgi:hypothetical protein